MQEIKKIFFLLHSMNVGGVEKSFLSLLSVIPRDRYEIHLGMLSVAGGFLPYVPKDVTLHRIDCYDDKWREINDPPLVTVGALIRRGKLIEALVHLFLYLHFKITHSRYLFYKYIMRNVPKMSESFDIAVTYAGPSQAFDYYVCKKVSADIKIGWIHFDVGKFGIDKGMTRKLYLSYKKVFIVSEEAKERFDKMFPSLENRTEVFRNIVVPEQVRELAQQGESFADDYKRKRILTVGRISREKGQDIALEALKILIGRGHNVRWYFVGEGTMKQECESLARNLGLEQRAVFLGAKVNPYGFIRDCDLYVQPSRHEGFCISLAEALCFDNPIVATDFVGAKEQLKDRSNALVCGVSAKEIAASVEKLLAN